MPHSFIYKNDAIRSYAIFEKSVLMPIDELIDRIDMSVEKYCLDREALSYMGESTDELAVPVMEDGKNIFQKIGEAVESILAKLGDLLRGLTEKIQNLFPSSKKKDKEDALKRTWEAHPELAEKFVKGLSDGSIKYSDYENIDKMVDDAMRIVKDLETGRIEAKTGIDKLNDRIKEFDEKLTPAVDLLNTIGGAARSISNIVGFKNRIQEELFKRQKNQRKKDYFWAEARKETYDENSNEMMTARTWRLKIAQKYAAEYSKTGSFLASVLVKLSEQTDKFGLSDAVSADDMRKDDIAHGRKHPKDYLIRAQRGNSVDAPFKPQQKPKKKPKGGKS